ncbi:cobalt ECF transporter T component CbiQ [Clostridium polyendosporum]|uniref:Cobalt ECF transporter T component CbiQ n=1 Tax=Clostridium polyendosporum TaxID=69208 RepID=A0A919RWI0_9CLOT|nr:cobalt ECF transporter T component CbiQ [Clostridium polyendosporum]GIM27747.1 cobalt ECF transporter T component CbiQ [Clostridium polyendosporum]
MSREVTMPEWLLEKSPENYQCYKGKTKSIKKNFVIRTLKHLYEVIKNDFLADVYHRKNGFLQKLDPRVKIVTFPLLIAFTTVVRSVSVLAAIYLFTLALAVISKLPMMNFIKKIGVITALFTFLMTFPTMFNIVIDGEVLFSIYQLEKTIMIWGFNIPSSLSITKQGLTAMAILILRVSISTSLGFLLFFTTPWVNIMRSLSLIRIPQIFITMLDMSYRYVMVLIKSSLEIFQARKIRIVGKVSYINNKKFISNSIGTLFAKSMDMSTDIYMAMLCRGYNGEVKTINILKLTVLDYIWIFGIVTFLGICIFMKGI